MTKEKQDEHVEVAHLLAQPTLSVRETVLVQTLGGAHGRMLRALVSVIARRGVSPSGPPVVRYHTFGPTETDMELAVPFAEPQAGENQVVPGELPGGPAITTWHHGAHDRLGEAYARLNAALQARNLQRNGVPWEVYTWIDLAASTGPAAWPDPSTWRTQLVQPLVRT